MTNLVKEKSGVVYTKPWVVELILDLAGYSPAKDLTTIIAVEPAAGDGAFLLPMVDRLLLSAAKFDRSISECEPALQAFELDELSAEVARRSLCKFLEEKNLSKIEAKSLAGSWIKTGDYLLNQDERQTNKVDFVIGNPPYIRLEDLEPTAASKYREKYSTMVGRADIYIAFFEAALKQLNHDGVCAFICADRWMRNQYGSALRKFISTAYSVDTVIEMHNANAFESGVSAYPAITVIRKNRQGPAVIATLEARAEEATGQRLVRAINVVRDSKSKAPAVTGLEVVKVESWFSGQDPWACGSPERLSLLKRLESEYYPLESGFTQTVVGIGVATGADQVYITTDPTIVENSRLLPMAMAFDFRDGYVNWSGHYLINPWDENGLVELDKFPRLGAYFKTNLLLLKGRHIAKKSPDTWYRTIDRVNHGLVDKKKLYIADIKDRMAPVLDHGTTYPHHNLYFVQSDCWDMEVLGGLLLSAVGQFFVECYGVRMRGGYLRFQAQYLRRIRVPMPKDVSPLQGAELRQAFLTRDERRATRAAMDVYKIDSTMGERLEHQRSVS
jgi:adenine-specific DNA-methyltransferase